VLLPVPPMRKWSGAHVRKVLTVSALTGSAPNSEKTKMETTKWEI